MMGGPFRGWRRPTLRASLCCIPHQAVLWTLLSLLGGPSVAVHAATGETKTFNIIAEPLSRALVSLASQADISIGLVGVNLTNRTSRGLVGYASVEDALQRILEGTGLGFEMVDAQTCRIFEIPATKAAALQQRMEISSEEIQPLSLPPIEEVTVTAGKRPVALQTMPLSIAVVSAQKFLSYGVRSTNNVTSLVAGLSASNQGSGRNKFFVRGLSDGAFTSNTQAAVGLYIDETRATFNAPDPNLQLFDIERVEIIRGPQGTLYGAGPLAGLVRIITKQPVFGKFESEVSLDASLPSGADLSGYVAGMANIPLIDDKLALRFVGYARHEGGYINNSGLGRSNVNDTETYGFRSAGHLRLSQDWLLRGGIVFQRVHAEDSQYYDGTTRAFGRGNRLSEPATNRFLDVNFTVEGDIEWADFVSTTAWLDQRVITRFDATQALPTLLRIPMETTSFDQNAHYRTINHESRLVSVPGAYFEWLAGVFVSHRNIKTDSRLTLVDRGAAGLFYSKLRQDNGTELAAFGEATLMMNKQIVITGGLRVYRGTLNAAANNSELIDVGPTEALGENKKTGLTPKVSISYRPTNSHLFYAEAAQGFRLGGVNIDNRVLTPPGQGRPLTVSNFQSDSLWSFELGSKSAFMDQKLIVNAAIYYAIWRNMQADLSRTNGLSFTANLGTVINPGLEIETVYAPITNFRMWGNLSWSNPQLTESSRIAAAISANRLPVVPRLKATIGAEYEMPMGVNTTGFMNVKGDFVGSTRLTNSAMPAAMVKSYQSINYRVGVQHRALMVSLYVNNLLNSASNTYAFGNPFSLGRVTQVTPMIPRTFGINVSWSH
jgi:iron complex outermembrane receptor protein